MRKRGFKEYFYAFITLFFLALSVLVILLTIPFIFHKYIFSNFFEIDFKIIFIILFWLSIVLILWLFKIFKIVRKKGKI